jgi:hypothetical protein
MPNLSEYKEYKGKLVKAIIENADCIALITNTTGTTLPAKSLIDTQSKVNQIHLYDFIPNTTDEAKTHVCIEVFDGPAINNNVAGFYIEVEIIVPETLMRMSGDTRRDALAAAIDKLINGSPDYGFGHVTRVQGGINEPADGFRGRLLKYYVKDWNMTGLMK